MKQLIFGFTTEGPTDVRFLESIIQRSFEGIAFECDGDIEILPVQYIEKQSGRFIDIVKNYAHQAHELGIMVLCIHADAERQDDSHSFSHKINPAFSATQHVTNEAVCKNLVAIVPVQMSEAWMLSDKALLKAEIGTNKSDLDLGLHKEQESYADPKEAIKIAIRIARETTAKRRRYELTIGELYRPIGQKVPLEKLLKLPSYQKFQAAVRDAFRKMNYLH